MANAKQQVEVQLFPDGNMRVKTHNIKGKKCMKYIELFEALLNAQTTDSAFTEEYYQTEETAQVENEAEVQA